MTDYIIIIGPRCTPINLNSINFRSRSKCDRSKVHELSVFTDRLWYNLSSMSNKSSLFQDSLSCLGLFNSFFFLSVSVLRSSSPFRLF